MKLAIKRLTRSDLTFFEYHFRTIGAGNQKSINLNAMPFVDILYPDLPTIAPKRGNEVTVALDIHGPGARDPYRISRKIVKGGTYKNWRLNGEFVAGPPEDPDRYNGLAPGDIAIMAFQGEGEPERLSMYLLSANDPGDRRLHAVLSRRMAGGPRQSMVAVSPEHLLGDLDDAATDAGHPARGIILDPAYDPEVEDAVLGGGGRFEPGISEKWRPRTVRFGT